MSRGLKRKESFAAIGTVEIRPFKLIGGEKVFDYDAFQKNNLIVHKGRETLMDLLIGFRNRKLTYIRWGKGGAPSFPEGDPLSPFEVQDTDEDIATLLLDKPLNPYNRISATELEFIETLISDEIDDDVNEAAMMFEDADTLDRTIFARITFPTVRLTIEKGTGIELQWVFNFNSTKEEIV
jgi:hypothetical protein